MVYYTSVLVQFYSRQFIVNTFHGVVMVKVRPGRAQPSQSLSSHLQQLLVQPLPFLHLSWRHSSSFSTAALVRLIVQQTNLYAAQVLGDRVDRWKDQ